MSTAGESPVSRGHIESYFTDYGPSAVGEFDSVYPDVARSLSDRLARIFSTLHSHLNLCRTALQAASTDPKDVAEGIAEQEAIAILCWHGANTFLAAVQLVRLGFYRDAYVLLRTVTEMEAVLVYLARHPGEHAKVVKGKNLKLGNAKNAAKQVLPHFSELYDYLSRVTHPNSWLTNEPHRQLVWEDDAEAALVIGGLPPSRLPLPSEEAVCTLQLFLWQMEFLVELIFFDSTSEHRFWRKTPRGFKQSLVPDEEKFYKLWWEERLGGLLKRNER